MRNQDVLMPKQQILCRLGRYILIPVVDTPLRDVRDVDRCPWALPGGRIVAAGTLRKIAYDNHMSIDFFSTAEGGLA